MKTISKTLKASSVAAALIVAGIPPLAQGQEARGSYPSQGMWCAPSAALRRFAPLSLIRANFTSSHTHEEQ